MHMKKKKKQIGATTDGFKIYIAFEFIKTIKCWHVYIWNQY